MNLDKALMARAETHGLPQSFKECRKIAFRILNKFLRQYNAKNRTQQSTRDTRMALRRKLNGDTR